MSPLNTFMVDWQHCRGFVFVRVCVILWCFSFISSFSSGVQLSWVGGPGVVSDEEENIKWDWGQAGCLGVMMEDVSVITAQLCRIILLLPWWIYIPAGISTKTNAFRMRRPLACCSSVVMGTARSRIRFYLPLSQNFYDIWRYCPWNKPDANQGFEASTKGDGTSLLFYSTFYGALNKLCAIQRKCHLLLFLDWMLTPNDKKYSYLYSLGYFTLYILPFQLSLASETRFSGTFFF